VAGNAEGRRRDYGITSLGRRVAEAESLRLASLVRAARAGGLLGRVGVNGGCARGATTGW